MIELPSLEAAREGARGDGGGRCLFDPKTCGVAESLSEQVEGVIKRRELKGKQK